MENVYYPPTIREIAPISSEAENAPEEAKTAQPEATLAITTPNELAEEGELLRATETHGSLNPEAPQEAAESIAGAQAPHVEEPSLLVQPLQTVPPGDVSKVLRSLLLSSPRKGSR